MKKEKLRGEKRDENEYQNKTLRLHHIRDATQGSTECHTQW